MEGNPSTVHQHLQTQGRCGVGGCEIQKHQQAFMGNDFAKGLLLICLKRSCKVRISPRQRSPDARSRAVPSFLHALSDVKFSLDRIVIRSLFGPWRLEGGRGGSKTELSQRFSLKASREPGW